MRIPGFEPEQVAWEATILTTRSYPHQQEENQVSILILFVLFDINKNGKIL